MSEAAFIQIQDLQKTFVMGKQKVHALAGINLNILRGSFTVIMGPSGSGKSTLLSLCWGAWIGRPVVKSMWMIWHWKRWMKMIWEYFEEKNSGLFFSHSI